MPMGSSCSGDGGAIARFLEALKEWQITAVMAATMALQAALVVSGFFRKRAAHAALHSAIWAAFIGLDAVAAYGIGLMLAGGCDRVFALWAPILLFHLGAADSINAYSAADNDLWRRQTLKMALEIAAAGYILGRSGRCSRGRGSFVGVSAIVFAIGSFKYLERVHALWCGSAAQVLRSSRAAHRFMASDRARDDRARDDRAHDSRLVVSGESSWYRTHKLNRCRRGIEEAEEEEEEEAAAAREDPGLVTYEDVVGFRELRSAARYINDACLAFALFKLFRRRLAANLRLHAADDDYERVRRTLFPPGRPDPSPLRLIRVIALELAFIFDGTFTKGAAMSSSGGGWFHATAIATRVLGVVLLFASAMYLLGNDVGKISCEAADDAAAAAAPSVRIPGPITVVLVLVSLAVECLQLYKMVRSNRTRVWLACSYVAERRRLRRSPAGGWAAGLHRFNARALRGAFRYVGDPTKKKLWHERIGQRSAVADALAMSASPWRWWWWRWWRWWRRRRRRRQRRRNRSIISLMMMESSDFGRVWRARRKRAEVVHVVDVNAADVHYRLFERMGRRFAAADAGELAAMRDRSSARSSSASFGPGHEARVRELGPGPSPSWASTFLLEEAVLMWHLATSVCEMELLLVAAGRSPTSDGLADAESVKMSVALSRYCVYLLVDAPGLTAADPGLCKPLYRGLVRMLGSAFRLHPDKAEVTIVRDYDPSAVADLEPDGGIDEEEEAVVRDVVASGIALGRRILEKFPEPEGRWALLMDVWVDIVVHMAVSENAHPHAEQLAKGGELLSHLWVLLGHLGFGHMSAGPSSKPR